MFNVTNFIQRQSRTALLKYHKTLLVGDFWQISSIPPERQEFVHKGLTADRHLFTPTVALTTTGIPPVFPSKLTRTGIARLLWQETREELHFLVLRGPHNKASFFETAEYCKNNAWSACFMDTCKCFSGHSYTWIFRDGLRVMPHTKWTPKWMQVNEPYSS